MSKSIGQVLQCSRYIYSMTMYTHSFVLMWPLDDNIHTPYNNIHIWLITFTPCHKGYSRLTTRDVLIHIALFHWCDLVLKNKERSIILHLKNFFQSFTVGKHGRSNVILNVCDITRLIRSEFHRTKNYETLYDTTYNVMSHCSFRSIETSSHKTV